jgi:hypothetical protein
VCVLSLLLLGACGRDAEPEVPPAAPPAQAGGVVDSVMPIAVALERFREGLEEPTELRSDITSRDALVASFMDLLARSDTLGFEEIVVSQAEWAWLYYPTNVLARPPYELPPGIAWFQLVEGNRTAVLRALRELGGRPVEYEGYACAPAPTVEGENRIWTGCTVTLGRDGRPPAPIKLFSAILERGGRFAVLSFDNDF